METEPHWEIEGDPLGWFALMNDDEKEGLLQLFGPAENREFHYDWKLWGRDAQTQPTGDWRVWLLMAGRGFGKTRAGAQWVQCIAEANPAARIALIAGNLGEAEW